MDKECFSEIIRRIAPKLQAGSRCSETQLIAGADAMLKGIYFIPYHVYQDPTWDGGVENCEYIKYPDPPCKDKTFTALAIIYEACMNIAQKHSKVKKTDDWTWDEELIYSGRAYCVSDWLDIRQKEIIRESERLFKQNKKY